MPGAAIVLAIACAALLLYILLLLREVRRIADTVESVVKGETNAEVYALTGNRQIRRLAVQINRLLSRHRREERQSRAANEAFKESIAGISHDLRTPLTSVSGYLQLLENEKTPPEKKAGYLAVIEKRLAALLALLDELFEYTRLEMEAPTEPQRVDVCGELREQLAMYYGEFARVGAEPRIEIPESGVYVWGDRQHIQRILQNLIKNMLTHGTGDYAVELVVGEAVELRFSNGILQELDNPARIFQRFYTGDKSRSGKTTGLGLSIVRQMAQGMGGDATAWQAKGVLTIQVTLPEEK